MRKDTGNKRFNRVLPEDAYPPPVLRRLREDRVAQKRALGGRVIPVQVEKRAHDAVEPGLVQPRKKIAVRLLPNPQDQIADNAGIAVRRRFKAKGLSAVKGFAEIEIWVPFQADSLGCFRDTHCPDSNSPLCAAARAIPQRGAIYMNLVYHISVLRSMHS